jgi:hypothetical protein
MRALLTLRWYDDNENLISSSNTANYNISSANTWQVVFGGLVAPANAVRATMEMLFTRSGGGNISVGDILWTDSWYLSPTDPGFLWDGDSPNTVSHIFGWTGGVGSSPSYRVNNDVDNLARAILAKYSTTSMRATRIRWNAQEQLSAIPALSVGKSISLVYKGTTTTYRIVGIDGSVDPSRYMIDYYLIKD